MLNDVAHCEIYFGNVILLGCGSGPLACEIVEAFGGALSDAAKHARLCLCNATVDCGFFVAN